MSANPNTNFHFINKISYYFQHLIWILKNANIEEVFTPNIIKETDYNSTTNISSNPKISVIITNFNYAHFLKEAIDSALHQNYTNKEIIVVDDGSTDDSHKILDSYKNNIIVVKQKNKGQAAAFNAGFKKCNGNILCFLDADDYWNTNKLDEVVKKFQEGYWGMVCHDLKIQDINQQTNMDLLYSKIKNVQIFEGTFYPDFLEKECSFCFSPTSGISVAREIAESFFPLHEKGWRICADTQIAFCCACLTPLGYINKTLGTYRLHSENNYFLLSNSKPVHIEITYLINTMLCYIKLKDLTTRTLKTAVSPLKNYRIARRWLFMTSNIDFNLLFLLWKKNIVYYRYNKHINYKMTATVKFIVIDTIIFFSLLFKIPSRRLKLRKTYMSNYYKDYNYIFADSTLTI